ncbi:MULTISPECIES: pyridoxal phosphate-dependent decarboxylase family protein [Pectobacterium]|jgi:L-2,4-diaminobutyrate decarboxylase|uniref:pyridoxal phosphate-dependent decarboxylase family protein n=1 Tax=Pectobacterium TaxID=122277 RepID=UPI00057D9A03|nr:MULTISPECIES: aspartate aminotransferase family protein [Pectobacterium]KHT23402.1 2,4-diaminobutyrate decarboxylase [Pectobacterium carotovorum subsp. carotovorum]MBA0183163.1 aspartate aminotransferase family protein [Pectobacterium versatile]MBQ4764009.1 aspartate aminotransferase family protein [Pectobacterium versatile]MCA6916392.1 aspartate aminotransferase family protein [Pectobacterium versatile]MCA6969814.1 aspartate aminotransferase family protein [Pectobacterium carotovorum]
MTTMSKLVKNEVNPILASSAQSIEAYQDAITQSSQAVMQWLQQPEMYQGKTVAELRERITLDFNPQGLGNQAAIERAIEYFLKDSLSVHHPQCVAHLHCPSLVVSQAAEVLINATNQSMDSWDQSPSATIIEMKLIEWLRTQVGYQSGDAGVFTSGGTQSNLMGLMLARDAFFARQGHSIQQDGLVGNLKKIKVFCSENAHFSVQKNMALLGLGYQCVTLVKTDRFARMDLNDLAEKVALAKANGEQILAIVATAGTTDAGAIDPLRAIATLAAEHQIWVHVDAAWGGALLLSEKYRDYLDGIELVDSITLDFHKQFFQTISCGAFLLKEARHYELMRYQAAYLNSEFDEAQGVPNLVSKSLQTTRRFDALKLWMGLEALGQQQYAAIIDHGVTLAQQVAQYVDEHASLELVMQPQLASVLFRFRPQQLATADDATIALLNQRIGDALLESGRANVGVTEFNGVTCLKLTLLNPTVNLDDVKVLLDLVESTAQPLLTA